MHWVVLCYSLPSKTSSSPRVTLWRRLRRLGAISPAGGAYILPAREECVEAFQWLVQEIRLAQGDALLMHVEHFDGLSDAQLIELFHAARQEEYTELDAQAAVLEQAIPAAPELDALDGVRGELEKLRRRHADIARVDYFATSEGTQLASRLARIAQALAPLSPGERRVAPAALSAYRDRCWVTRPRPHVDRLACIWLIRRFIDPDAIIRYASAPESDEVGFDMAGGMFGHQGQFCTFETMVRAFGLDDEALRIIAEIVHAIDLRDGRSTRPEIAGIDAVLHGWLQADLADEERERAGVALFEGLYQALGRS
jgi:hypothetical protein